MATPELTRLAPLAVDEAAGLAMPWPHPAPGLALRIVEPMQVLSLRHLPGDGTSALAAALAAHALPGPPGPGRCSGIDPRLIWRSPNEVLLLTQDADRAATLLAALRLAPGALTCAFDLSAGSLVPTLQGSRVDALPSRLVDANALPCEAGAASRVRRVDIAAVVWRDAPDLAGARVERTHGDCLASWLSFAAGAI